MVEKYQFDRRHVEYQLLIDKAISPKMHPKMNQIFIISVIFLLLLFLLILQYFKIINLNKTKFDQFFFFNINNKQIILHIPQARM